MKSLLTFSLFLLLSTSLLGQRKADNWVLGYWAGLNFSTGDPVPFFFGPVDPSISLIRLIWIIILIVSYC